MNHQNITFRLATFDDIPQIENVMKASMKVLGQGHYSESQIVSCLQFICVPDQQLINDGTYFVALTPDEKIVGCGGWSFRGALHAGHNHSIDANDPINPLTDPARIRAMFIDPQFSGKGIGSRLLQHAEQAAKERGFCKASLGATVSGIAFYTAKGWRPVAEEAVTLPDGNTIRVLHMEKNLSC